MIGLLWLVIWLVVFASTTWVFYRFRYRYQQKGEWVSFGGNEYFIALEKNKGQINGCRVIVKGSTLPEASFVKRTGLHRWFEKLRKKDQFIIVESSPSDSGNVHVNCDNTDFVQAFFLNRDLVNRISNLFSVSPHPTMSLTAIHATQARIMFRYTARKFPKEDELRGKAEEQLPVIIEIAKSLDQIGSAKPSVTKDPLLNRINLIQALVAGMASSSFVQFIALNAFTDLNIIHLGAFFKFALTTGALAAFILLYIIYQLSSSSRRLYRVMIEYMSFGILGLLLTITGILYTTNYAFDNQPSTSLAADISEKYIVKSTNKGRTRLSYKLDLEVRLRGEPIIKTISVHQDFYNSVKPGEILELSVKPGVLGFVWIEKTDFPHTW